MHSEAYAYIAGRVSGRRFERVVEFGSLNINGSVRPLIAYGSYLGVDLQPGPGVDEVADASLWRTEQKADLVVCCEVLEHTPFMRGILVAAYEALRPAGELLLTCATDPRDPHSAVDGGSLREGEYYRNVDPQELKNAAVVAGLEPLDLAFSEERGDLYAWMRRP